MANTEQLVFQLLEAMNIVSSASVQQVNFDRTIICTITDASKAKEGVYQVSDGSVKFEAHAEETNYREKDQVRVQIPDGDMTQDKYIIGKAIQKNLNQPINYVSPSQKIVGLTDKLITSSNKIELIATSDKKRTAISMGIDVEKLKINLSIIDSLVVGFKAQTFFLQEFMQKGNYGVIIQLSDGQKTKEFEFNNNYFLGNTYAFAIPTAQEALFDVKDENFVVKSIRLDFYQDGNFQYINPQTGVLEDYTSENEKGLTNIIFSDFFITFGNSVNTYEDNTVKIFTDVATYDVSQKDQNINLNLVWYNKTENNEYLGFSDGKVSELKDTNIVNSYSEIEYDDIYADHQKLNQTYQSQLAKDKENRDTPLDELGLRLYRACLDEQKEYSDIVSNSTNLDALLDKIIDRIENETDKKAFSDTKNAIKTEVEKLQKEQELFYNGSDTLTPQGNSIEGILSVLKRIYNRYEKINTAALENTININENSKVFENILSNIENIITQLENILKTKMSSTGGINQFNLYSSDLTKYKTLFEESKNKIQNYFFIDNNNETKDFFELIMEYNSTDTYNYIPYKIFYEDLINNDYANKYCIYWYRKNSQETNFDKYSGAGWTRLEELDNKGLPVGQSYDKETLYYSKTPVNLDDPAVQAQIPFSSLNSKAEKESFKAVVIFNHQYYTSNIIEIENINQVIENASLELVNGDLAQDFYQFYNEDYELINDIEAQCYRKLKPKVNWYDKVNDFSWEGVKVTWFVPVVNSMLVFDLRTSDKITEQGALQKAGWTIGEVPDPNKGEIYRSVSAVLPLAPPQSESAQAETNEDSISTPELIYQIRDFYSPHSKNNTIKCTINYPDGKSYDAEKSIGFGALGTNGSDYTIQIAPSNNQNSNAIGISRDGTENNTSLFLDIKLIDQEGKEQPIDANNTSLELDVTYSSGLEDEYKNIFEIKNLLSEDNKLTGVELSCSKKQIPIKKYYILLKITSTIFNGKEQQIQIGRSYPIALRDLDYPYFYEGPKIVTYNYQGGYPQYYKKPCNIRTVESDSIGDIAWKILYLPNGDANIIWKPDLNGKNELKVPSLYIKEEVYPVICATREKDNGLVVWAQPLLIQQNLFASALLNDWTGKTEVGDHVILSNMVGAGTKNANNKFSGVLMGDVQEVFHDITLEDPPPLHGLYGFQNNDLNFALTVDGKLRLGNNTSGTQLIFDGSNSGGTIMSNNYLLQLNDGVKSPTVGMKIDLKEGHIDAYNFKLKSSKILIDSNATNGDYFSITDNGYGKIFSVSSGNKAGIQMAGWKIDNNSIRYGELGRITKVEDENGEIIDIHGMWLCSSGTNTSTSYTPDSTSKTYTDLNGNTYKGPPSALKETDRVIGIAPPNTNGWVIAAGQNFGVTKDGNLYASNAILEGVITATKGAIGGWTINDNMLNSVIQTANNVPILSFNGGTGEIISFTKNADKWTDEEIITESIPGFKLDSVGKLTVIEGEIYKLDISKEIKVQGNANVAGSLVISTNTLSDKMVQAGYTAGVLYFQGGGSNGVIKSDSGFQIRAFEKDINNFGIFEFSKNNKDNPENHISVCKDSSIVELIMTTTELKVELSRKNNTDIETKTIVLAQW